MVYKCLDNKSTLLADKSNSGSGVKTGIMSNQKVAEELLKPMRRNCLEVLRKNIAKKKKTNKKEFRVIERNGDKLYVKCEDYDNSINNWINRKDINI